MNPHVVSSKVLSEVITREKNNPGGIFTVKSKSTGKEYSYKIKRTEWNGKWFTHIKVEKNGGSRFVYLGWFGNDGKLHRAGSVVNTPAAVAIAAVLNMVAKKKFDWLDEKMELYHAGSCLVCGKTLTDSESINRGIGPVCAGIH